MQGVVLNEPSVLASIIQWRSAVGGIAGIKASGREPNDTEVHRPIRRGAIDNFEISQQFLRTLISRVQHHDHPKRSHLVIGVPGSSTPLERRSVKDAARDAKAGRVDLIDEGLAAALGAGVDFEDEQAHLVVDIGGGTTNSRDPRVGRLSLVPSAFRRLAMRWMKQSRITSVCDTQCK